MLDTKNKSILSQNETLVESYRRLHEKFQRHVEQSALDHAQQVNALRANILEIEWSNRKLAEENSVLQEFCTSWKLKEKELVNRELKLASASKPKMLQVESFHKSDQQTAIDAKITAEKISELSKRNEEMENAYSSLAGSYKELEAGLEESSQRYELELKQQKSQMNSLIRNIAELKEQIESYLTEKQSIEAKVDKLNDIIDGERDTFDKEIRRISNLLDEKTSQYNELKRENFILKRDLESRSKSRQNSSFGMEGLMVGVTGKVLDSDIASDMGKHTDESEGSKELNNLKAQLDILKLENEDLGDRLRNAEKTSSRSNHRDGVTENQASTLEYMELKRSHDDLMEKLRNTSMKLEHQFNINQKIKKLFLRAVSVGIPSPQEIPVTMPQRTKQLLTAVDEDQESLKLESFSNVQMPDAGIPASSNVSISDSPESIKNHIQLIDLYNKSLKTISKLTLELEKKSDDKNYTFHNINGSLSELSDSRIKELTEERDAWKENTRKLEQIVWDLQNQIHAISSRNTKPTIGEGSNDTPDPNEYENSHPRVPDFREIKSPTSPSKIIDL